MKKILVLETSFLISILTYSIIILVSYFSTGILLLEIIISFLPFLVYFNILLSALLIILVKKGFIIKKGFKSKNLQLKILTSITALLFITNFYITGFSFVNKVFVQPDIKIKTNGQTLRVGFFNKYYLNTNYDLISDKIKALNLDIMGFSELSIEEFEIFGSKLNYPYKTLSSCDCKLNGVFVGNVALFSKYSFEVKPENQIGNSPMVHIILKDFSDLNIIVIHPDAPVNSAALQSRNYTFNQLQSYIKSLKKENSEILIMGDFNLASWSKTFRDFISRTGSLYDSSKGFGISSTWRFKAFGPQIDHILLSKEIAVTHFKVDEKLESDHNLIWVEIRI